MIKKKVDHLLNALSVENSTVAGYAGCTPGNLCRLRSGGREYKRGSATVDKFANGICSYCLDSGKMNELCSIIGIETDSTADISEKVKDWLFIDEMPDEDTGSAKQELFSERLSALIRLAKINNTTIGKILDIDASYISRMRTGDRLPKKSTGIMLRICAVIAEHIKENGDIEELGRLTGINADEHETTEMVYTWLYGREMPAKISAVRAFIDRMGDMSAGGPAGVDMCEINDVPEQLIYNGDDGFRAAVVRFLKSVIQNRSKEIMLYSDSSMSWMTGDFIKVWASLMTACLKNGTRIKIIHNVERSVNEMTNAIISWMPLYLSGLIEPYYSTSPAGSRYSCTIFIDPENACVHSFGVREGAAETEYFYFTDEERIDRGIGDFEALLSKCSPLLEVLPVSDPNENTKVCDIGSVRLYIEENSVTVNKLEEPTAAFRFTYPPMCKAFKSFADAIETGRELL